MATKRKTAIFTYKTYSLVDGKDPVIYELQTKFEGDGRKLAEVARAAGVSPSTPRGWFFKNTRRPMSASLEAFGRALGYKRKWVKWSSSGEGE